MRLYLSEKAARALKNLPPEDYLECEEHGRQRYARAPRPLEEEKGSWMCSECVKIYEAQHADEIKARRREEEEAKEAKKAAKKAAKDATGLADDELAEQLKVCKEANLVVRELQQELKAARTAVSEAEARQADAQARLEQAQRDLEQARQDAETAGAQVPGLETKLETERGQLDGLVVSLQETLNQADDAWKSIPPRQRKKRDRRSRHSAVQIINANKRWHERHGSVAPVAEGEEPMAEEPVVEESEGEAAPALEASETPLETAETSSEE